MAPGGAYMALGKVWGSLAGALAAAEVIRLVRWASLGKHTPVTLSVSGQPRQARAFNHSRWPYCPESRAALKLSCGAEMPRVRGAQRASQRTPPDDSKGGPEGPWRPDRFRLGRCLGSEFSSEQL